MHKPLATALLLFGITLAAQNQNQMEMRQQVTGSPSPTAPKISKEQRERGLKLLELAEAEASGLQGGMRAYAQLQLARAYAQTDKPKAIELLENAMTATQEMDKDYTRTQLQQQVLRELVPLAPQRAEELLPQIDAGNREQVLNALLGYYEKNNDLDHAMDLVYRLGQEKEIPYGSVGRIMAALPPERSGDALQLFTIAFASYRDHDHTGASMGGSDFASLILRFWPTLPKNLVHEAIDEVLKQAAKVENTTLNMGSDKGTATFNSFYDYRLFELLPVLKHIDEAEAEELLKKNQELKAMLTKYPEGAASISPEMADPNPPKPDAQKRGSGTSFSISQGSPNSRGAGSGGGFAGTGMAAQAMQEQQLRKIAAEADQHPDNAIAQASSIADLRMRAQLFQMIARSAAKKDAMAARSALEKLLALGDQLEDTFQLSALRGAADLYLQMGEKDEAKKVVERGFKLAEKLLKTDTNADDPNGALKAYWPSAEAFRSFTRLAGQVSPDWALTMLKEISDPEMKALATMSLAQGWLDVSRGTTMIVNSHKGKNSMMISNDTP